MIERLRCFRGIDTLTAAGLCAEVGDFGRLPKPSLLSGFLGVVPSERTSDTMRRQGSITKTGPPHARRLLVEAAHHCRHRPFIGETLARRKRQQQDQTKTPLDRTISISVVQAQRAVIVPMRHLTSQRWLQ